MTIFVLKKCKLLVIIDIDERDVKYERAGYSPTEPIIPHSVAIDDSWWLSWPPSLSVVARWSRYSSQYILTTHFSFQKWSKYSGEIFVSLYSDHYPYHLISQLGRWSKYSRDIFVSLLPAGTPDPIARGALVIIQLTRQATTTQCATGFNRHTIMLVVKKNTFFTSCMNW